MHGLSDRRPTRRNRGHHRVSANFQHRAPVDRRALAWSSVRSVQHRDPGRRDRRSHLDLPATGMDRSEEHTSELQSLMRISYAVFCLKKKKTNKTQTNTQERTAEDVNLMKERKMR